MNDVTRLLEAAHRGESHAAAELLPLVYTELRRLAAAKLTNEKPGQTLDATALVHEAYLRLVGTSVAHAPDSPVFDGRGHFFAAAESMRRVLIEQVRRRKSLKRGGGAEREQVEPDQITSPTPDDELLALSDALDAFAVQHPEKAALVKLWYFAGLTADQAAEVLGMSPSTADRHWAYARAWLIRAMGNV